MLGLGLEFELGSSLGLGLGLHLSLAILPQFHRAVLPAGDNMIFISPIEDHIPDPTHMAPTHKHFT